MSFSIYHCGRCGSLFPAELGHNEDRVCSVCKQPPGTGEWPSENATEDSGSAEASPASPEGKTSRVSANRHRGNVITWIVVIWTLLMGSALWLHRYNSDLELEKANRGRAGMDVEREKAAMLAAALPECHKSLLGFLKAGSDGQRLKFVADPVGTARKMESSDGSKSSPQLDVGKVVRVGQELLTLDGGWVVRTRWQEGAEGARFDAVFRRESGTWLLDWGHFTRFSDYQWKLFLAGSAPEEGEFRLLAKEIPVAEETERRSRKLRFELLAQDAGDVAGDTAVSQQLVVDRLSDEGLLLGAAFEANREGGGPFDGALTPMEPEGLVRVRVVVKRIDFGGVRKFEIAKVIACHWISSDEPGYDLWKLKEDAFGPG